MAKLTAFGALSAMALFGTASSTTRPCPDAPVMNNVKPASDCLDTDHEGTCTLACEAGYRTNEPLSATCLDNIWHITGFCLRPGSDGAAAPVLQSNWDLLFYTPLSTLDIDNIAVALADGVTAIGEFNDSMVRVDIKVPEDLPFYEDLSDEDFSFPEMNDEDSATSTTGRGTTSMYPRSSNGTTYPGGSLADQAPVTPPGTSTRPARRLAPMYSFRTEISIRLPAEASLEAEDQAAVEAGLNSAIIKQAAHDSVPLGSLSSLIMSMDIESAGPLTVSRDYIWVEPEWVPTGDYGACDCDDEVKLKETVCSIDQWTLCPEERTVFSEECSCDWDAMCPWGASRAEAEEAGISCGAQFGISLTLTIIFGSCLLVFLVLCIWAVIRTPFINSGGTNVMTEHGAVKAKYNIEKGTSESQAGKKIVKWSVSDDDAKKLFPEAGTLSTPKKEDIDVLFRDEEIAPSASMVLTKDPTEQENAQSPRAEEWLKDKTPAWGHKEQAEYFSHSLGTWRPGYVTCARADGNLNMHVRMQYDMHLPLSGQTRHDAGLFDLRHPFAMAEKVEVFMSNQGGATGTWEAGEIAAQPTVSSTTYGYMVKLEGNAEPKKVPSVRIRRNFQVDEQVLVYLGIEQGWVQGHIKTLTPDADLERGDAEVFAGSSVGPDPMSVAKWDTAKDVPKGMVPWKLVGVMLDCKTSDRFKLLSFPTFLVKRPSTKGNNNSSSDNNLADTVLEGAKDIKDAASNLTSMFGMSPKKA